MEWRFFPEEHPRRAGAYLVMRKGIGGWLMPDVIDYDSSKKKFLKYDDDVFDYVNYNDLIVAFMEIPKLKRRKKRVTIARRTLVDTPTDCI